MVSTPTPSGIFRTRLQEVSLGMVLLGVILSSIVYGIMLTQIYKYYQRFKRDPPIIKLMVFAVFLLNTASVLFVGHAAWYYLVTTGPRNHSIWSLNVDLALSMIMSGLSETFLAFRVYQLSGNKYWLTGVILALAALHLGSGEVAAIELLLLKKVATFHSVKVPTILRLSSAACCDTAIAVSLSYFLNKKRSGFKKTDEIINHLIIFSINSGMVTSIASVASLVTYLVVPKTWIYTALCILMSRLYATTFLCSLNSRQILLQNTEDDEKHTPIKIRPRKFVPIRSNWSVRRSGSGSPQSPTQIDVFVVTETVTDGPRSMASAKIRHANTHVNEIMENSSTSTLGGSSSSSRSESSG